MPEKPLAKKYEGCNFLELERRDEAVNQTKAPEQGEGVRTLTARERAVRARNEAILEINRKLRKLETPKQEGVREENDQSILKKMRKRLEAMDPKGIEGTPDLQE